MQHYHSSYKNNNAFECYRTFLALKRHFTTEGYSFFKYNGKVNVSLKSFESRSDIYYFDKLSKTQNWKELALCNLSIDSSIWVGDLFSDVCRNRLTHSMKMRQALLYYYTNELKSNLLTPFDDNFIVRKGEHPHLLVLFLSGKISLETMTILNCLVRYTDKWDKRISDPIIWPRKRLQINKYEPFLQFDRDKFREKTVYIFNN